MTRATFGVAAYKCSGGICLLTDIVYVRVEAKFAIYCDAQIFPLANGLKLSIMDGVVGCNWLPFSRDSDDFALVWVERHTPLLLPHL